MSRTKIKCRIHIKRDHPNIYNANEAQFSQLSQTFSENFNSETENCPKDLNEFLKLVTDDRNGSVEASTQDSQREENLKKCIHCPLELSDKTYKGVRGLKIHHNKMHKDIEFSYFENGDNVDNITIESIEENILNKHMNQTYSEGCTSSRLK